MVYNLFFKRLFDILSSLCVLIIVSPLLLVIAIWLHFANKGAGAFFYQPRPGKGGHIFKIIKYRTMTDKRDVDGNLLSDEKRLTNVGNFVRSTSIDELPQLVNVLKGDMSLVGPRPNLPREVAEFSNYHRKKLLVKPGLTCYWQVAGRNEIGFEEWMELDIKYLKERTLWIDIKLIIRTFFVLFGDKNAR